MEAVPPAEYQIITDKKRRALQMVSPVPLIPGKASVIVKGEHAKFSVDDNRPSFYMRLAKEERFGIVRLTPKKNLRIVENISIIPVAKQALEERKQMETFEQQLASGLYRIWPEKPLTPGEYALVEFSDKEDADDVELLVWDFAYQSRREVISCGSKADTSRRSLSRLCSCARRRAPFRCRADIRARALSNNARRRATFYSEPRYR